MSINWLNSCNSISFATVFGFAWLHSPFRGSSGESGEWGTSNEQIIEIACALFIIIETHSHMCVFARVTVNQ